VDSIKEWHSGRRLPEPTAPHNDVPSAAFEEASMTNVRSWSPVLTRTRGSPARRGAQATGSPLKIGMVGAAGRRRALGALFVFKAGHPVKVFVTQSENLKGLVTHSDRSRRPGPSRRQIAFAMSS